MLKDWAALLGLDAWSPWYRALPFGGALLGGLVFWGLLWYETPQRTRTFQHVVSWAFLSLSLWQPLCEELLFRGLLQGVLRQPSWGSHTWGPISAANALTSLVFVLGHFWAHPPLWALAVLGPSLLFGYFRDRYASIYPAIALHTWYNVGYFALMGLPKGTTT